MSENESSNLSALEQRLRHLAPAPVNTAVADAAYEAGRRDAEAQLRAEAREQVRREMRSRLFIHRLATAAALGVAAILGIVTALNRGPMEQAPTVLAQGQDIAEQGSQDAASTTQQIPDFVMEDPDAPTDVPDATRETAPGLRLISFWLPGDSTLALESTDQTRSPYSYRTLRSTVLTDDAVRLDRLPHSSPAQPGIGSFSDRAPPTAVSLLREVAS